IQYFVLNAKAGSPINSLEGEDTGNRTLAIIEDSDATATANNYHTTVYWGDGSATEQGVLEGGGGTWNVVGHHTYAKPGSYAVYVSVTESRGTYSYPQSQSASAETSVTIADLALTANGVDLAATAAQSLTNVEVAMFSDADTRTLTGNFAAWIDW